MKINLFFIPEKLIVPDWASAITVKKMLTGKVPAGLKRSFVKNPEQYGFVRMIQQGFQSLQEGGGYGGTSIALADFCQYFGFGNAGMRVQHHGPFIGVMVAAVEPVEFVGIPEFTRIGRSDLISSQRGTAAAHLIAVFSSFEPVFKAIAVGHQRGGRHGIIFQVIDKKAVLSGREAHVDQETGFFIQSFFLRKRTGRFRFPAQVAGGFGRSGGRNFYCTRTGNRNTVADTEPGKGDAGKGGQD